MSSNNPLGYATLAFNEDFNGSLLDATKWKPTSSSDFKGYGQEVWDVGHVMLDGNGNLKLTATIDPATGVVLSGEVRSLLSLARMVHGYYNFRMKLVASRPGAWPGAWLETIFSDTIEQRRQEIDICECDSSKPSHIGENLHSDNKWVSNGGWADPSGLDYSQGFHDYGVDYTPDHIDFYVDGVLRRHYIQESPPIFFDPMQLRVSLSVFGPNEVTWAVPPSDLTVWPMVLLCDSIQFWVAGSVPPTPAIDATPPLVTIVSPHNGDTVLRNSDVVVMATASDNVGIKRVDFLVNGVVTSVNAGPYMMTFRTTGKPSHTYKIAATAYDLAGNASQPSVISVHVH